MFSQSTAPFVENCLTMCLVPLSIICLIELQICGYIQIIKYRLNLINCILKNSIRNNVYQLQLKYNDINFHTNNNDGYTNKFKMHKITKVNGNTKTLQWIINNCKSFLYSGYCMIFCINYRINCKTDYRIKKSVTLPMVFTALQRAYQKLSILAKHINYIYGIQVMVILTIKFATLTTLLYFCGMDIIK